MSDMQKLKELLTQRLAAMADEILELFQASVAEYVEQRALPSSELEKAALFPPPTKESPMEQTEISERLLRIKEEKQEVCCSWYEPVSSVSPVSAISRVETPANQEEMPARREETLANQEEMPSCHEETLASNDRCLLPEIQAPPPWIKQEEELQSSQMQWLTNEASQQLVCKSEVPIESSYNQDIPIENSCYPDIPFESSSNPDNPIYDKYNGKMEEFQISPSKEEPPDVKKELIFKSLMTSLTSPLPLQQENVQTSSVQSEEGETNASPSPAQPPDSEATLDSSDSDMDESEEDNIKYKLTKTATQTLKKLPKGLKTKCKAAKTKRTNKSENANNSHDSTSSSDLESKAKKRKKIRTTLQNSQKANLSCSRCQKSFKTKKELENHKSILFHW